ncbi:hypothetical protein AgCh_023321 [Apium graveolens]
MLGDALNPKNPGYYRGIRTSYDAYGISIDIVVQAATKSPEAKVRKHDEACKNNQHVFMPFAFDTFEFLASDDVEFPRRVHKIMNKNVMTADSADYNFGMIEFAIQGGIAAQLVTH